ncbi:c-type cytochrome [Thermomicrobium sp.]
MDRVASGKTQRTIRQRWIGRIGWFTAGMLSTLLLLGIAGWVLAPRLLAHRSDLPGERRLARTLVDRAAARGAQDVPSRPLSGARAVEHGRIVYLGACSQCHGADADGKGWLGALTYPPASALNDADTQARSDAELYWIIANGLSFTGMPGFQDRLSEEQIWAVVAYLRSVGSGASGALPSVPQPSSAELARADPTGNAVARGAALFVALGCSNCHGIGGNAPGRLQLRATDRRAVRTIREGTDEGMPAYPVSLLSEPDLQAVLAHIRTFRCSP